MEEEEEEGEEVRGPRPRALPEQEKTRSASIIIVIEVKEARSGFHTFFSVAFKKVVSLAVSKLGRGLDQVTDIL